MAFAFWLFPTDIQLGGCWPCLWQGVGLWWCLGSLPTQTILWLYELVRKLPFDIIYYCLYLHWTIISPIVLFLFSSAAWGKEDNFLTHSWNLSRSQMSPNSSFAWFPIGHSLGGGRTQSKQKQLSFSLRLAFSHHTALNQGRQHHLISEAAAAS